MRLQRNLLRLVAVFGGISSIALTTLGARRAVPVRGLSQPDATSPERYGDFESVRSLNHGRVLLNDNWHRRLLLLDSALRQVKVVLDTDSVDAFRYSAQTYRLYAYRTDSSAIKDASTSYYLVLDADGNIDHRRVRAKPGEVPMTFSGSPIGFDQGGNAIITGSAAFIRSESGPSMFSQDHPIQRVNTTSHQYEQVGRVDLPPNVNFGPTVNAEGSKRVYFLLNPLRYRDNSAVLSDGTIALVRAQDYRVDLVLPNGTTRSSSRLPYERRKLSDGDKQRACDSVRVATMQEATDSASNPTKQSMAFMSGFMSMRMDSLLPVMKAKGSFEVKSDTSRSLPAPLISCVPNAAMADRLPPFLDNAAVPDLDTNLWIRTTNTAGLAPGESLYDVIDNRARLVQHVRVPAGRTIVGFGHDGIVYLKFKDGSNSWALERTHVEK